MLHLEMYVECLLGPEKSMFISQASCYTVCKCNKQVQELTFRKHVLMLWQVSRFHA